MSLGDNEKKSHSKGLTSGYLEDRYSDDEDRGTSLDAIKNKFKSKKKNGKD